MLVALLTLTYFSCVGAATIALLRLQTPSSRAGLIAYSYVTGVAASGAVLYLLVLARVPVSRWTVVALALAAVLVLTRKHTTVSAPSIRHSRAATLLVALPLLGMIASAAVIPIRDFDGRVTWLPKARAVADSGGIHAPYFHGTGGLNLHNHYPILIPLDAAVLMLLSGDDGDDSTRFLYVFITVASVLVLRDLLAFVYPGSAAWVVAAIAWLPALFRIEGGALAAYNDVALMGFAAIATASLVTTEPPDLRALALFLVALMLTKNEGVVISVSIVVAAIFARRLRTPAEWSAVLLPVAGAGGVLLWWRMSVPAAYDEQYNVLVTELPQLIHRLPAALRAVVGKAFELQTWGWFWPISVVSLLVCAVRRRREVMAPLTILIVVLAAYAGAFTVTSWDIGELANVAVDRLLLHVLGPACCIIAAALEPKASSADDLEPARRSRDGVDHGSV